MLRGRTRVSSACQRCRRQKIRCSGARPCRTCHGRGLTCEFGTEEKQIQISERELFELKQQVKELKRQLQTSANERSHHGHGSVNEPPGGLTEFQHDQHVNTARGADVLPEQTSSQAGGTVPTDLPNPLVPDRPVYISEASGKIRYLGHASTYAFTQQLLHVVQRSPPTNPAPEILLSNDGHVYKAECDRLVPLPSLDVSGLPSKETAMYYLECVKFRTKPLLYLFDDSAFGASLQQFYSTPATYAASDLIWYTHFLVLMALGRSLDPHDQVGRAPHRATSKYFTRALQSLPDMTYLCHDNMKTTELFCSMALYLQSIDHRQAALLYISQAVKVAQLYALHLDLEEDIVGSPEFIRCRRLWWTVYTLDRRLTLSQGIPDMIEDGDIRNPWPLTTAFDDDETAMAIHVKTCQLLGKLTNRVYSSSWDFKKAFIATTQAVLLGAASVNEELTAYTRRHFGEISRVLGHLELAYHHCIMLACRPALYSLLRLRFKSNQGFPPSVPTPAMTGLLQACIDSAFQSVQTLTQLQRSGLLDTFLPFDLECAFSAALILTMAEHVLPRAAPKNDTTAQASAIIKLIADRGSVQAGQRSVEVEQLASHLANAGTINVHDSAAPGDSVTSQSPGLASFTGPQHPSSPQQQRYRQDPWTGSPFFDEWNFDTGLTADQITNLADALNTGDISSLDY